MNYEGEVVIKRLERNAGEWWLTSEEHKAKTRIDVRRCRMK